MATIVLNKTTFLNAPITVESLSGVTFGNESRSHKFVISCMQNGELVNLTGSVSARFIRSNGTTILLAGSDYATIEDGKAVVTLHQDCYNVPGRFQLAIFNTNTSEQTTACIYACVGTVQRTQSGELIDSGEAVPDITELIAQMEACEQATTNANTATSNANTATAAANAAAEAASTAGESKFVRYDAAQTLTDTQKGTALGNIGGASADGLELITGAKYYGPDAFTPRKAYNTSGDTVDITSPVTNANWVSLILDCSAGDWFTIWGKGGASYRLWAFADENGNILTKADSNKEALTTPDVIQAPAGAAKLVINCGIAQTYKAFSGMPIGVLRDMLVDMIPAVDATLAVQGDAADAKAAGDAITALDVKVDDAFDKMLDNGLFIFKEHTGYLKSDGTYYGTANHSISTEKSRCYPGDTYEYTGKSTGAAVACLFYTNDTIVGNQIYGGDVTDQLITVPEGVTHIVFSSYAASDTDVVLKVRSVYSPVKNSPLFGKKINVFGDSYVRNHKGSVSDTWHYKIATKYGMTYRNYGINGNPMCLPKNVGGSDPMIWRYTTMDKDTDYVIVIGGTNDYNQQGQTYEEGGVQKSYDFAAFKSGLDILIPALQDHFKTKSSKIVFFTIWCKGDNDNPKNKAHGQKEFNDAIVEACNRYGIPVFDSWTQSGMTPYLSTFSAAYYQEPDDPEKPDTSHLNPAGHDRFMTIAEHFLLGV